MESINNIKIQRMEFLKALYEKSNGSTSKDINPGQIGEKFSLFDDDLEKVVQYLENEGLLKFASILGDINITNKGIIEIEKAMSEPNTPTHHSPTVYITNIGTMVDSQFQQGTTQSNQTYNKYFDNNDKLQDFINLLKENKIHLGLNIDESNELDAEIQTLEAQLKSIKPKKIIIDESIKTIRSILEGVAGNIISSELIARLLGLFS